MTTQASKDAATYQVTEWAKPKLLIDTVAGRVGYIRYLQWESDRLRDKWCESWIQTNETGEVALFTWAGTQLPVEGDDPKE